MYNAWNGFAPYVHLKKGYTVKENSREGESDTEKELENKPQPLKACIRDNDKSIVNAKLI